MQAHQIGRFDRFPRRHGESYDREPLCTLNKEIEDFYALMSATSEEHNMRLGVVKRITEVILAECPTSQVKLFGSFATGLYLPTSDMDLVVLGEWDILPMNSLAQALLQKNVCDDTIQVLEKSAVPIIKMTDKATNIKVDISFNMSYGVKTAEMIKHYVNVFPMLPKLVLVLKQFLAQKGRRMNEVFYGGISSYSLILMVISFLQLHPRRDFNHRPANLGLLLIEFFELYGKKFNYVNTAISIKNGGQYLSKDQVQNRMPGGRRQSILCIEDPITPGNDVSRGSYGAAEVKKAFEHAFNMLKAALEYQMVSRSSSILGQIIQINDQVIRHRQQIRGDVIQTIFGHNSWNNYQQNYQTINSGDYQLHARNFKSRRNQNRINQSQYYTRSFNRPQESREWVNTSWKERNNLNGSLLPKTYENIKSLIENSIDPAVYRVMSTSVPTIPENEVIVPILARSTIPENEECRPTSAISIIRPESRPRSVTVSEDESKLIIEAADYLNSNIITEDQDPEYSVAADQNIINNTPIGEEITSQKTSYKSWIKFANPVSKRVKKLWTRIKNRFTPHRLYNSPC